MTAIGLRHCVLFVTLLGCGAKAGGEPAREPTTTTAAVGAATRSASAPVGLGAEGWMPGTVGASVMSPITLRHDQIAWGPPPPVLPPGAKVAVIDGDPAAAGKMFALRVRMPDGYKIAPHWHFADEHVTVVSGTFRIGHGDTLDAARMDSVPAGGYVVLPARHHHFAMSQGDTEIQIHGVGPWKLIYVNPADDPSRAPVARQP